MQSSLPLLHTNLVPFSLQVQSVLLQAIITSDWNTLIMEKPLQSMHGWKIRSYSSYGLLSRDLAWWPRTDLPLHPLPSENISHLTNTSIFEKWLRQVRLFVLSWYGTSLVILRLFSLQLSAIRLCTIHLSIAILIAIDAIIMVIISTRFLMQMYFISDVLYLQSKSSSSSTWVSALNWQLCFIVGTNILLHVFITLNLLQV